VRILAVCTGNVARSAMLGYMLTTLGERHGANWRVRTAGTHAIEGSTMSSRTRDALVALDELGDLRFGAHRSHQMSRDDIEWADIVLTAEADNARYGRILAPEAAGRVVQLRQFVEAAPARRALDEQLALVAGVALDARLDVIDPAGGDQGLYDEVARTLWRLSLEFAAVVATR
jgi:low molecular weight protein-tyrosine phosphatase